MVENICSPYDNTEKLMISKNTARSGPLAMPIAMINTRPALHLARFSLETCSAIYIFEIKPEPPIPNKRRPKNKRLPSSKCKASPLVIFPNNIQSAAVPIGSL